MNTNGSTLGRVVRLLEHSLNVTVPSVDTDLIAQDLIDSVGLVELLLGVEQEFGIQLELEELDLDSLRSAARIAALVEGVVEQR